MFRQLNGAVWDRERLRENPQNNNNHNNNMQKQLPQSQVKNLT